MSLQGCKGTSGFPLKLSQNLFSPWAGGIDPSDPKVVQRLLAETDFEVNWYPPTNGVNISVNDSTSQFLIQGLDTITSATSITYGTGSEVTTYKCQPTLSLVKIQHPTFSQNKAATQELILTFRIDSAQVKQQNPSAPDVILLCRPVILVAEGEGTPFWQAVNRSAKTKSKVTVDKFSLADLYTFNGSEMLPMMTYETCVPTQLIGGPNQALEGATRMRVHVVTQPLLIPSSNDGTGICKRVSKFVLPVHGLVDIFGQSGYTKVQFTNGRSADGKSNSFPKPTSPVSDILTLAIAPTAAIDTWNDVLQKFEYLVPKSFLGKSLSEIAKAETLPKAASKKKAYKCYTIDPLKDIVDDKILVDPTTGETVQEAKKKYLGETTGGDAELTAGLSGSTQAQGLLPGDVEQILLILFSTVGGIYLLAQFLYILRLFYIHNYHDAQTHSVYFIAGLAVLVLISALFSSDTKK